MSAAAVMPKPLEKHLQKSVTDFLVLDGWRALKTDPVSRKAWGKGFGELGMADHLYIRYRHHAWAQGVEKKAWAEVLWIEFKREKGGSGRRALFTKAEKAKIHQKAWHAKERALGAFTLIAGEEFEPTIDGFRKWYAESGLARRVK